MKVEMLSNMTAKITLPRVEKVPQRWRAEDSRAPMGRVLEMRNGMRGKN